jgi:hypothetical protein
LPECRGDRQHRIDRMATTIGNHDVVAWLDQELAGQ